MPLIFTRYWSNEYKIFNAAKSFEINFLCSHSSLSLEYWARPLQREQTYVQQYAKLWGCLFPRCRMVRPSLEILVFFYHILYISCWNFSPLEVKAFSRILKRDVPLGNQSLRTKSDIQESNDVCYLVLRRIAGLGCLKSMYIANPADRSFKSLVTFRSDRDLSSG